MSTEGWLSALEAHGVTVPASLVGELRAALDEARRLGVSAPALFLRPWVWHLTSGGEVGGVRWAELVLVEAAASGDSAALAALDSSFLVPAVERVARAHLHVERSELAQAARQRLYVGDGLERLRSWRGRGSLAAWLRTVATRLALDAPRPTSAPTDGALLQAMSPSASAELSVSDLQRWPVLRAAFTDALRRLPRREKVALRLVVFQSLSPDQIARIFHVAPSTARRWLEGARAAVLTSVRQTLTRAHGWPSSQVDSLIGSSLTGDLSFTGLLSTPGGPRGGSV